MPAIEKRTVSLPAEQAQFIDTMVASGSYASASEVVRAGLRALQAQDSAVELWLRTEVAASYDAAIADPTRTVPLDDVLAAMRARHADRMKMGRD